MFDSRKIKHSNIVSNFIFNNYMRNYKSVLAILRNKFIQRLNMNPQKRKVGLISEKKSSSIKSVNYKA